jgi:SAM-dependent methyltransferase
VDGCDLVPEAVDRLNGAFGSRGDRFVASDIGAPDPGLPSGTFGLVSVMNVLLHLTDDEAFRRALGNVAGLVAPGGSLILIEPILLDATYERPPTDAQTSRARALAAYRDPLLAAGLELIELRGAVALANNPIEAGSRRAYERYLRWWRWVARRAKTSPGSIRWVGPLMLALDRVALAAGAAPSSKIVHFRRPT